MKNHISVLSMQCCICDIFREFRRCAGCCDEGKENEHVSNRLLFFFPCSLVCLHYLSVIKVLYTALQNFVISIAVLASYLQTFRIKFHRTECVLGCMQAFIVSSAGCTFLGHVREGLRQVGQMFAGGLAVFSARPLEDLSLVRLAKGLIISSRERNDCVEVPIVREC